MNRFLTYHDVDFSDGRMLNGVSQAETVSQEYVDNWVKKIGKR